MKKLILISVFISSAIFGQEESQSQSIELPDFVITGKENISIPKIQKQLPDFIPLLSQDFFTPQYPNQEQTTIKLPNPETEIVSIGNYKQKTNALLKFNAGLETFPSGVFYYNDWIGNFTYNAKLFGKNELEYVKKAGVSLAGVGIGTKYFVDHKADFLPGLEIDFNGNYYYDSYNFFGSSTPNISRTTNNGFADISFNYVSDPFNNFGMSFSDSYYEQKDEFDENIFGVNAYYKLRYSDFDFRVEGSFKNQSISNINQNFGNQYYFNSLATVGLTLYDIIKIKAGIYLAESEGNTFFSPVAYGSLKLNKSVTLFGEFSPNTEFKTLQNFKTANRYFQINNFPNLFLENKFNLKFAAKFEYEKYFEISAGAGYLNSDNNFYFEDRTADGFFKIFKEDIENTYVFLNFLFRKGPFGEFYAEAKLQNITSENNKDLTYSPNFKSTLHYSYDWNYGYGLNIGLIYFGKAYTDYENNNSIPEAIDLNASFYYELFKNFKLTLALENILNNKYYYFRNYEVKPIDLLLGFEFRW